MPRTMSDIALIKKGMRSDMKNVLMVLSGSDILERSIAISNNITSLPIFQSSQAVSCFISMPKGEVQTSPLLSKILPIGAHGSGKRCFVPQVTGATPTDMIMVEIQDLNELNSFPKNKWKIPEPPTGSVDSTYKGIIDIILVPGVIFDKNCNRMGHGKGYYDCYIKRITESHLQDHGLDRGPVTIGLCFDEQVLSGDETVPIDDHDIQLDYVVTPSGVYSSRKHE